MLQELAEINDQLNVGARRIEQGEEVFEICLRQTNATVAHGSRVWLRDSHSAILNFPRFYPAVPLELRLEIPVFHPNVHPENGFVCLWERFLPAHTVIQTVFKLQRILSWSLFNREADHLMQPKSLQWFDNPNRAIALPLEFQPLRRPAGLDNLFAIDTNVRPRRRRLF
jgi:ubiquitin-protein ligase